MPRCEEDHRAVGIGHAEDKDFALDSGDAFGLEIHHGHDLSTHQLRGGVVYRQLSTRQPHAELGAEVDAQHIRRMTGTAVRFRGDNPSHTNIGEKELVEADRQEELSTKLSRRPGTQITLRTVLPSRCRAIPSSARASASAISTVACAESVTVPRVLPLTCTPIVT